MDSIQLQDENGETSELYVLEETSLNGNHYLLLSEEAEGDSDAYIFREIPGDDGDEATYVAVDDETEYSAVLLVFKELLEDTDFE